MATSETTTMPRPRLHQPPPVMEEAERRALAKTVAKDAGGVNVARFFEANKEAMARILPQHMTADRFLRVTLNALRTTPKLMECTLESLFGATIFCAQVGLEPNTPQQHVFLIPFKNSRKNRFEVQVIIGYKGFIELARRSGQIVSISAQPVYAKDSFNPDYLRVEDLSHKPFLGGDRGEIIGAWAYAKLVGGGEAFDFLPRSDIDKVRDGSQGYRQAMRYAAADNRKPRPEDSPWIGHYDQMARKTAVRRLAKMLPMSVEMAAAAALDERDDRRASQGLHRLMQEALDGREFSLEAVRSEGDEDDEAAEEEPRPAMTEPARDETPAAPAADPPAPARQTRAPRQQRAAAAEATEPSPPAQQPEPDIGPPPDEEEPPPHPGPDAPPAPAVTGGAPKLDFG